QRSAPAYRTSPGPRVLERRLARVSIGRRLCARPRPRPTLRRLMLSSVAPFPRPSPIVPRSTQQVKKNANPRHAPLPRPWKPGSLGKARTCVGPHDSQGRNKKKGHKMRKALGLLALVARSRSLYAEALDRFEDVLGGFGP